MPSVGVGCFMVKFGGFALIIGLFVLLLPVLLHLEGDGFVRNFLAGREYDRVDVVGLPFRPCARMSLVAATLLLGFEQRRLAAEPPSA